MSSNSRMDPASKGPAEEFSLPPTRVRKDVLTVKEGKQDVPRTQGPLPTNNSQIQSTQGKTRQSI